MKEKENVTATEHAAVNATATENATASKNEKSSLTMTSNGSAVYMVESFMEEHYALRRNLLSGKTEMAELADDLAWEVLTKEKVNSIVRTAKKMGVGGKKSPRQDIEEYIESDAIPDFDPIRAYLMALPK